jgi:hypothetical protein
MTHHHEHIPHPGYDLLVYQLASGRWECDFQRTPGAAEPIHVVVGESRAEVIEAAKTKIAQLR